MAYSLQADIEKRIPAADLAALTDDVNGTVTDTDVVDEAIATGDALINMYLRPKHTVPLTTVPDEVRKWSEVLASHYLYRRRLDLGIPETLKDEYDQTIEELKLVSENGLIIDDDGSHASEATYYKTNKTSDSRIFTQNDEQSGLLDRYFSSCRITPYGQ